MNKHNSFFTPCILLNKPVALHLTRFYTSHHFSIYIAVFLWGVSIASVNANGVQIPKTEPSSALSLASAIDMAQTRDDWLIKSQFEQQRLLELSEAAGALPDPVISVGLLNLPSDSFAFDQEPMTQLKVGITQMLGRGNTLALQTEKLQQIAAIQPIKRADRQQKIAWQTTLLWLEAYESQASFALVQEAEPLFNKLSDIVNAGYASSLGKANQQDLIRAELELVRLKDRMVSLSTTKQMALSKLAQFLFSPDTTAYGALNYKSVDALAIKESVLVPNQKLKQLTSMRVNEYDLYNLLNAHPVVLAIEQQMIAENTNIEIAKESDKPQFGINASYALRDNASEAMGGANRADFFTVGMSVSLPLFSKARHKGQVNGSIQQLEAIKTQKRLVLRELMAGLKSQLDVLQGASKRLAIFDEQILPQMSQQTEATLNAYTNDTGNFADVVRARISELDAKITRLNIDVNKQKALAAINYYLFEYTANDDKRKDSVQHTGWINNGH